MENLTLMISIAALVVAVIAVMLALNSTWHIDSIVRHKMDDLYEPRMVRHSKEELNDEISRQLRYTREASSRAVIAKPIVSASVEPESETLQETTPSEETPQKDNSNDTTVEITLPTPIPIYMGSYKTGSFKYSSPVSDAKTIYCITAVDKESNEGIINLDPNAYEKVAETPDYLEGACIVSGNGLRVKVTKPGTVIKKDGNWEINDQIEVELF